MTHKMTKEEIGLRDLGITVFILLLLANTGVWLYVNFKRASAGGKFTACQSNCKNIGTALEMYASDNEKQYPCNLSDLTPNYLTTIPTCPGAGKDSYTFSYRRNLKGDYYIFYCMGKNHGELAVEKNYPQYNAKEGLMAIQ